MSILRVLAAALVMVSITACGRGLDEQEEYAQAVGDVMSSLDESSGATTGAFAHFEIKEPRTWKSWNFAIIPEAQAASCLVDSGGFSSCVAGVRTRTFGGCTLGLGRTTLEGSVTLTFLDSGCSMGAVGAAVTRVPNFSLTGRRGATLTVSSLGGGQTITKTAVNAFSYQVGGVKRVLKDSDGETIADIETKTLSAITITGTSRSNRVMTGGELEIKNLTKGTTLVLSPSNVTWNSATCNCAVTGSFTGKTSGDEQEDFTLTITGCGTATVEAGGKSEDVTFDRCAEA